jgi:GTP-binding protein
VVSFHHEKFIPLGGPDGGDGGKGGSVYLVADKGAETLQQFKHKRRFRAESGKDGAKQKKHGAKGDDLMVKVPLGTMVFIWEGEKELLLADLSQQGQKILAAKGGRGGLGNVHFATSRNQAPKTATKGEPGEEHRLALDLRLIADVGIIGYPNAGKSTLLTALSKARPKIADYPFTTIEPALGVVETGMKTFVLAEIPGLVDGAHLGRGLGHEFLRHAERTKILLHLIDGSAPNVIDNMNSLNRELALYKPEMAQKPQIVAVNKIDLPEVQARLPEISRLFKSTGIKVFFISAVNGQGLTELMQEIVTMLDRAGDTQVGPQVPIHVFRPQPRVGRTKKKIGQQADQMDIGVLGGTFDPIHSGHLVIAEEARLKLKLNRVIFVPAGQPWLKTDREITPAVHRIEMVKRAIAGKTDFELLTVEVDHPGPSYAVDTVAILQRQLGEGAKIFFLIGWDSLVELPQWHDPARLVQLCKLVGITRSGLSRPDLKSLEPSIPGITKSVVWLDIPPIDSSSSDIRDRVARGLSIRGLVPDNVASYIKENKLYRKRKQVIS